MGLAQGLLGVCSQGLELGFSHLEAPLELKDTFSRWLIHMATAPYDLDFSIGLSDCPHDMEANFPSRERAQEWAMPSRPSPESHMPSECFGLFPEVFISLHRSISSLSEPWCPCSQKNTFFR